LPTVTEAEMWSLITIVQYRSCPLGANLYNHHIAQQVKKRYIGWPNDGLASSGDPKPAKTCYTDSIYSSFMVNFPLLRRCLRRVRIDLSCPSGLLIQVRIQVGDMTLDLIYAKASLLLLRLGWPCRIQVTVCFFGPAAA
jgi:hypothetical protein